LSKALLLSTNFYHNKNPSSSKPLSGTTLSFMPQSQALSMCTNTFQSISRMKQIAGGKLSGPNEG
jgi:hypothetical protein